MHLNRNEGYRGICRGLLLFGTTLHHWDNTPSFLLVQGRNCDLAALGDLEAPYGNSWDCMKLCEEAETKLQAEVQWVDLWENLQETIDFPMTYGIFL